MKITTTIIATVIAALSLVASAQQTTPQTFNNAASDMVQQLKDAEKELDALRKQVAAETVPLRKQLDLLESKLIDVRSEYQQVSRKLDRRTLDLTVIRNEIKTREQESTYLSNLLGEYIRNFESGLHIAEAQRYEKAVEAAKLAPENTNLNHVQIFQQQASLLTESLVRLEDALAGVKYRGSAVDSSGKVHQAGTFVMVGPAALFASNDNSVVGTAEQRVGSLEPTVRPFGKPEDITAATKLITDGSGLFPLDPTLGNAHRIEELEEGATLQKEIQQGGLTMVPLGVLAGMAAFVTVILLLVLLVLFLRNPSWGRVRELLNAIASRDQSKAKSIASKMTGPVGKMLRVGVEHLEYPRDLIEEVMYERVLATRLRLRMALPIIAITASAAPLLGLLGTVTGIIETFAQITMFGAGDVKNLSGGISIALITTKYGLIVAIPALLVHAVLWLLSRSVTNRMEQAAVALVNQVSKTWPDGAKAEPQPEPVKVAPKPAPESAKANKEDKKD